MYEYILMKNKAITMKVSVIKIVFLMLFIKTLFRLFNFNLFDFTSFIWMKNLKESLPTVMNESIDSNNPILPIIWRGQNY